MNEEVRTWVWLSRTRRFCASAARQRPEGRREEIAGRGGHTHAHTGRHTHTHSKRQRNASHTHRQLNPSHATRLPKALRHKGRIERLRVQLAYGFEARTQHQLSSSWHKGGGEAPIRGRERERERGGGAISRKVIECCCLITRVNLFGPQRMRPSCRARVARRLSAAVVSRLAYCGWAA